MVFSLSKWPQKGQVCIEGQPVEVQIRVNQRSRHYRLSLNRRGEAILSVPVKGRWRDAKRFLEQQEDWLASRLKNQPRPIAFLSNIVIPVRGKEFTIKSSPSLRGQVEIAEEDGTSILKVPGGEAHLARRLTDWLKSEARNALEERSSFHAARLGVTIKAVRVRSQSSRWGSCSSAGVLNYNWRLILAPEFVLDYVAAHEVAHRREMNHSAAFWDRVRETLPQMSKGRDWLKVKGPSLMAYEAGK